ncbi:hypothetical protein [Nostoc sp.]|uniref:hypothetical protein n=1 Tax=Nostoc sp. TaxID=1180 RepID=UPI002FEF1FBD
MKCSLYTGFSNKLLRQLILAQGRTTNATNVNPIANVSRAFDVLGGLDGLGRLATALGERARSHGCICPK